jgi:hypothetical protein
LLGVWVAAPGWERGSGRVGGDSLRGRGSRIRTLEAVQWRFRNRGLHFSLFAGAPAALRCAVRVAGAPVLPLVSGACLWVRPRRR